MSALCVLGAGTMGRGIAACGLAAGFETTLVDVEAQALPKAREAIAQRLARDTGSDELVAGLRLSTDLDAAAEADAVVEAVPELPDLKRDIFARLGRAARPGTLLATNTSTISVTRIAEACEAAERVIGLHFFNPVHRMALVEVVVGERTTDATLRDALDLVGRLGKDPIVVKDVPGFVTSRLGLLLGNEAMRIVEEGIASAEDVDKAMKLGYRHPMGPLELADLVGLDARLNNVRSIHEQTGLDQYRPPAILERRVAAGRLGRKSGAGVYDYDATA